MKKIILLVLMAGWFSAGHLMAQPFQKKSAQALTNHLQHIQMEWASLDADTLLDVVLTGELDGELRLVTLKNNGDGTFLQHPLVSTGFRSGHFQLIDWTHDNKIDLLLSGTTLVGTPALFLFENEGAFAFQKNTNKLVDHGGEFRLGDLNQDGRTDLVTLNNQGLRIYQNLPDGLSLQLDRAALRIHDVSIFDYSKDGRNDLIVSASNESGEPQTFLMTNQGHFKFESDTLSNPLAGRLSALDYNLDGRFDLMAIGTDESNLPLQQWWSNEEAWSIANTTSAPAAGTIFTGDLNSDGFSDALVSGRNGNTRVNQWLDSAIHSFQLDTLGLQDQVLGDFDRDGDLDLVQVIDSIGATWIKLAENKTSVLNARPEIPTNAFAISAFDRTFLFWEDPADDHTLSPALTYDVWLGSAQETLIAPSFDLMNGRRQTVTHGNAGTNTSMIVNGLTDNRYYYYIQSIDNAYNGSYSLCTGGVLPCFDLAHDDKQVCKDETVVLTAQGSAWWFSTTRGFLSVGVDFSFTAIENDTIFSFVPQGADCSKNKVWVIHVNASSPNEAQTIYACEGSSIQLGIEPGWNNVTWNTTPPVLAKDTIPVQVTKEEKRIVTAQGEGGCSYQKEFTIKLSKPTLTLNGDSFQMMKGGEVQLTATTNAAEIKWAPPTGLSNDAIPDPIATPSQTTAYTVTATDSVGCQNSGHVLVQVEETAFVPNLFTPNGDGKNDVLLVYGLTQASDFKFRIFNREGNVVYETSAVSDASGIGWNGTANGTQQPSGVYYWKVEGKTITGGHLLLNGKKTGSILLVH